MKSIFSALMVSLLALALSGPVSALETGTPAWTTSAMTMLRGPGNAYDAVGDVGSEERVYVERCQKLWCQIRTETGRGWVSSQYLAYGHEPKGPFTGPRLKFNTGDAGEVCLFEGRNFTGPSVCGGAGFVVRDLLLYGVDNHVASIAVNGDVSVTVCRDRFFQSYCQRFSHSVEALPPILINSVSSLRVYGAPDGTISPEASEDSSGDSGATGSHKDDRDVF